MLPVDVAVFRTSWQAYVRLPKRAQVHPSGGQPCFLLMKAHALHIPSIKRLREVS